MKVSDDGQNSDVFCERFEAAPIDGSPGPSPKHDLLEQLGPRVVHELKNMLLVVMGYTSVVLDDPVLTEESRHGARQVQKAAERAVALANQVLCLSKPREHERSPALLSDVVSEVCSFAAPLLRDNIELRADLPEDDACIDADARDFSLALINLVINARDSMPQGGAVSIQARIAMGSGAENQEGNEREASPCVQVDVVDEGVGMDSQTLERVRAPYFSTKGKSKGTGLGMAMVDEFVGRCNGRLCIESAPDQGTTVTMVLPLSGAPESARRVKETEAGHMAQHPVFRAEPPRQADFLPSNLLRPEPCSQA